MPQKRPAFFPSGFYHIYNRGSHRAPIFAEPENYLFVLRLIKKYLSDLDLTLIAYCLLPNHYHLLVRQNGEHAAGLLVQRVFNSYSKAYNKRYNHSGTLFEGSYRIKAVAQTTHLLQLCRYIHANPVKAGLVADPAGWPYSNYQEWLGDRAGTLVDRDFVNVNFPVPGEYFKFVQDYLTHDNLPKEVSAYLETL